MGDHGLSAVTVVTILPVVVTSLAMVALFFTVGTSPVPNTATLAYGVANPVIGGALYRRLSAVERGAVIR